MDGLQINKNIEKNIYTFFYTFACTGYTHARTRMYVHIYIL